MQYMLTFYCQLHIETAKFLPYYM